MILFLFDKNQLWEESVLHQLKRHVQKYPEDKWGINGRESKFYWKNNSLRPDMILSH